MGPAIVRPIVIAPPSSLRGLRRVPVTKLLLDAFLAVLLCYALLWVAVVGGAYLRHRIGIRRRLARRRRVEELAGQISERLATPSELDALLGEVEEKEGAALVDEAFVEACRRAPQGGLVRDRALERGVVGRLLQDAAASATWKRVLALEGLRTCGSGEALPALRAASQDPAPEVRRSGRDGLLADGSPEAIRALLASLLAEFQIRPDWRGGLFARVPVPASPALLTLLRQGALDDRQEKLALELLGDAAEPQAAPIALERLASPDPERRATAARVLGKLGVEPGAVAPLLTDREWFVRAAAARAFETLRADSPVLALLESRLADTEWWVRSNAAQALVRQGEPGLATLFTVLEEEDSDKEARDVALSALSSLDLPSAGRARLESIVRRRTPSGGSRRDERRDERRRPRGAA